jgi:tRNA (guanine-N7-)-methyltransferase
LSPTREAAYRSQRERWVVVTDGGVLDLDAMFAGLPVVLDIGFGGGESVVQMAAVRPQEAIIGVEVHTPGVAHVLAAIEDQRWSHVRVVEDDVLALFARLPAAALAGVRVWFPDPWPKRRQQHRRLLRAEVIASVAGLLCEQGTLHVATDDCDYARSVESLAAAEPRLVGGVVPRPEWRPFTRYERRALTAGRAPVDLIYTRVRR